MKPHWKEALQATLNNPDFNPHREAQEVMQIVLNESPMKSEDLQELAQMLINQDLAKAGKEGTKLTASFSEVLVASKDDLQKILSPEETELLVNNLRSAFSDQAVAIKPFVFAEVVSRDDQQMGDALLKRSSEGGDGLQSPQIHITESSDSLVRKMTPDLHAKTQAMQTANAAESVEVKLDHSPQVVSKRISNLLGMPNLEKKIGPSRKL